MVIGTDGGHTNFFFDFYTLAGTQNDGGGSNNYLGDSAGGGSGSDESGVGASPANSDNTRGFEFRISKSALGYSGTDGIKVMAMYIADDGFLSNQFLTPAGSGDGNYTAAAVTFGAAAPGFVNVSHSLLPVAFTSIQAKPVGSQTYVDWQTATETNNAHFNIERSTDSRHWQTLGQVAGAGTTQEVQNYTFADKAPAVGTNYYRIQQVDYDGAFSYSAIVSAQWKGGAAARLFPNPAATTVRVDLLDWEAAPVTLSLYDMLGRMVLQHTHQGTTDLDISHLPTGAYLLKATQGDALLLSELLMVE
jgi:hypothetical protein